MINFGPNQLLSIVFTSGRKHIERGKSNVTRRYIIVTELSSDIEWS